MNKKELHQLALIYNAMKLNPSVESELKAIKSLIIDNLKCSCSKWKIAKREKTQGELFTKCDNCGDERNEIFEKFINPLKSKGKQMNLEKSIMDMCKQSPFLKLFKKYYTINKGMLEQTVELYEYEFNAELKKWTEAGLIKIEDITSCRECESNIHTALKNMEYGDDKCRECGETIDHYELIPFTQITMTKKGIQYLTN